MKSLFKHGGLFSPNHLAFIGLLAVMTGLSWSNALVSIGSAMLILPAFWSRRPAEWGARLRQNLPALLMGIWVLWHLVAGIWSSDPEIWWKDLSIKLPLPLTLVAFTLLPAFSPRQIRAVLWMMLLTAWVVTVWTLVRYLGQFEEVNASIRQSEELHVASGRNHIYFSLICAASILAAHWMKFRDRTRLFRQEDRLLILVAGSLFLMMHVLTARTGLLALYLTIGISGALTWLRQGKYLRVLLLGLVLLSLPLAAYFTIPSFRHRVENTREDISRYVNGDYINYYSISMRLEANRVAWEVWLDQPLIGTGAAEFETKMERKYIETESSLIPANRLLPHFQYLEILVGWGLIGLLTFLMGWFSPFFFPEYRKSDFFFHLWLLFSLAMFSESILERQIGIALTGMLWGLSRMVSSRQQASPAADETPPEVG